MKRPLGIFFVLILVLGGALAYRLHQQKLAKHGPAGGSGVIEGVRADVTARIAGRILNVLVNEGDTVQQGQLVAELEPAEPAAAVQEAEARRAAALASVSAAQNSLIAAQEQLAASHIRREQLARDVNRLSTLKGSGAATSRELDQAQTSLREVDRQLAAGLAQIAAAQDQIAAAQASAAAIDAARARAQVVLDETKLLAPVSGIVQTRNFEPGEVVLPGSVLLTVIDLSTATTTFYLPNAELGAAAPGRQVAVVADAYPGRTFSGTILRISAEAEFTPRNVQTRQDRDRLVYAVDVEIPNPDGLLRAGMPVDVRIGGPVSARPANGQ